MRIELLGGFRVSVGARAVGDGEWRLKKAASLVKLLALEPGHRLHREQVMDLLWPDLEAGAAANNLHRTLHSARHALEPQAPSADSRYLRLRDEHLELCPEGYLWVDAEVFEEATATARRARDPAAYRAAVDLYAGELLPGDRYEAWAEDRREALRQTYLTLLLEMAGLYEKREEYGQAIEAFGKAVAEEPAHEGAHAGLVRLYAFSGHRDEALRQYERLREVLRRELAREPDAASRRLYQEIVADRFPPARPSGEHPTKDGDRHGDRRHNLPAATTSFVGRGRELVELKRALAMTRLLTLTGAGGSGKTRLALEGARDLVGAYPDGVWLVELAPLSQEALVPNAVAQALGVRDHPDLPLTDMLVDSVGSRRMLLVLDNCEHLIDATARLVDTLLRSCEHLRVLATSREALGVAGESNWLVPSLTVPDAEHLPAKESLAQYEAVQLFVERARSRLPAFALTSENARSVVEICSKLDGIPLAIELATARMAALAMDQIAERLEDSLGLLTTGSRTAAPRQRTLRATLAWSYELLSEPERKLFERLSVFAGGWTLEAAEAVGAEPGAGGSIEEDEVLDLLSKLVDKSLVVTGASEDGALRYRMLEPIRQYARGRLEESGETERVRERHAKYYLALAEEAEPELMGPKQGEWLERLEREHGNFRAALSWALDRQDAEPEGRAEELGLRLATALARGRFWNAYGTGEGCRWLQRGLARSGAVSTPVRAKALSEAGYITLWQGDYEKAVALLEEGLTLFEELGDKSGLAISLFGLGRAVVNQGDHARAKALREEAEALRRELVDRRAIAFLLIFLAMVAIDEGDHERLEALLEESIALFRELGDKRGISTCLCGLGLAALEQGDREGAAALFEEMLRLLREVRDKVGIVYGLRGAAGVAALRREPARAARLWGAEEALREAIAFPKTAFDRVHCDYEGYHAALRSTLDKASFDDAWAEGRAMSPEEAIEYALSAEEPSVDPVPEEPPPALSPREREIALLVGRGLTNRQISEELSISEHTAAAHVRKILKKLGLRSRTQIPF